jgi:hypothetical protein
MGKKSFIKSLGKVISNITIHELLFKYTNRPESVSFLSKEVVEYRDIASQLAAEYNWNLSDFTQIKTIALKNIKETMSSRYPDVIFPKEEATQLIKKAMKDIIDFEET